MSLSYDGIYNELFRNRIILISTAIDDEVAQAVIGQLTVLSHQDKEKDIQLYLNSAGGVIPSCLAIYDTMQWIENDVNTVCVGRCDVLATLLLAAGQTRCALPNSLFFFQKIEEDKEAAGFQTTSALGNRENREGGAVFGNKAQGRKVSKQLKDIVTRIINTHTKNKVDEGIVWGDHLLGSKEAVEYSLIDRIVKSKKEGLLMSRAAGGR